MKVAFNEKCGKKDAMPSVRPQGSMGAAPRKIWKFGPSKCLKITFSALKKTNEITFPQCKNTHRTNDIYIADTGYRRHLLRNYDSQV